MKDEGKRVKESVSASGLFDRELETMPKALRLLAEQITAPDHVPAMCLRDASAMIESLAQQRAAYCETLTEIEQVIAWCDERRNDGGMTTLGMVQERLREILPNDKTRDGSQ